MWDGQVRIVTAAVLLGILGSVITGCGSSTPSADGGTKVESTNASSPSTTPVGRNGTVIGVSGPEVHVNPGNPGYPIVTATVNLDNKTPRAIDIGPDDTQLILACPRGPDIQHITPNDTAIISLGLKNVPSVAVPAGQFGRAPAYPVIVPVPLKTCDHGDPIQLFLGLYDDGGASALTPAQYFPGAVTIPGMTAGYPAVPLPQVDVAQLIASTPTG